MVLFPLVQMNTRSYNGNNSLFIFNIRGSAVKSEIAKLISKLTTNDTLDLRDKDIDDNLFLYIIESISVSSAENITLILSNNQLTNKIFDLNESLLFGKKITSIDLSKNSFTDTACEKILKPLQSNFTLQHLNLSYNNFNTKSLQKIEILLDRNKQIHQEFSNYISYVAIIFIAYKSGISQPILDRILLEYCNMAFNHEARLWIAHYLIPQAKQYVLELLKENPKIILKKLDELDNALNNKCFGEQQRIIFNEKMDAQLPSSPITISYNCSAFSKNTSQSLPVNNPSNNKNYLN